MRRVIALLFPRTLSTRLILLAALVLLLAQAISFIMLYHQNRSQWITMATAPAVLRIVDAIEAGDMPRAGVRRFMERVAIRRAPPVPSDQPKPEIQARATEMLSDAGIKVLAVRADMVIRPHRPDRAERLMGETRSRDRNAHQLRLAVQTAPDRWYVATSRMRRTAPPFARRLIGQTVLIFAVALVPLLWIGRRLSRPLTTLTGAVHSFSDGGTPAPLPLEGAEDIRDLTRAFNVMQARIAAMLSEKDQMLGAIGHDLRTPLASLRVRVESVDDDTERASMVATIEEMSQMLDDILSLARLGRSREDPQRVDLAELVDAVVEDFVAMGGPVSLEDSARTVVSVHPLAMRRAIRNLIDNAVKYGTTARVSVSANGDRAMVSIIDEGPGIDPGRLDEMMEPFTRLESSRNRQTGGTGLGLALVRAIMRQEGGEVRLSNRPDASGLVATLTVPLASTHP